VRSPWLFVLVFLAYLVGPAPAKHDPREPTPLASVCSVPFLRFTEAVYPTAEARDQVRWAGRVAGAFWTAAAVAVTFEALRTLDTGAAALVLALLVGFASPLWSWASRSDSTEAPAAALVAGLLWLGVRRAADSSLASPPADFASGALAACVWGVDPSLGLAAPLATLACVRSRPWTRKAALFAAAGATAAALAVWRLGLARGANLHDTLPRFSAFDPAVLAAYVVSPGRGLVLFAPVTALAVAAVLRRDEPHRLVLGSGLAVLVALVHLACLGDPWGPQTFGPALLAPFVPLLAAMASGLPALGLRWGSLVALPVALAHATVVLDGRSAWDSRRVPVAHPDAVWDPRDSPFSDLVYGAPPPDPTLFLPSTFPMPLGEHEARAGDALPWLAFGWEEPEPTGTWASGRESWIVLAVPPGDYALTLTAAAPRVQNGGQRLEIERPGGPPVEVEFPGGLWEFQPVTIRFRPQAGVSVLKLRAAHTWRPGRGDVRRLSLFVTSLRLQRIPAEPAPRTEIRRDGQGAILTSTESWNVS
jgi:hypothetical protein